jgi:microcin C transport system substrate-binding protein
MRHLPIMLEITIMAFMLLLAMFSPTLWAAHAVAQFGEPKYVAGFTHFDYANPNATKGGTLNLALISQNSSFDKYNPFTLKGKPAPGLLELVFETLTINSWDEVNTQYGLLADDIQVAPDFGSVTFHINEKARFSNGDAVTAHDVEYSFATLTSKQASPKFKSYFSEIARVAVVDRQTVRFEFKRKGRDVSFIAGSLPVFSPKWGIQADGSKVDFDKLRFETPVGSGVYIIERAASGQGIVYRRNPAYWGNDIPTRRGAFNFERVAYKVYKDTDTQVAALRAGEFDFLSENKMRYWCCQYIGKRFDEGELLKEVVAHSNPPAMNGWVVNLRRERFQDRRVRQALNYAMDFEWMNQKIFASEFKRQYSFFSNSPLAASGLPSADELKLLEPLRDEIPPEVFGPVFKQPNTHAPSSIRQNLTKALELFAEAGWHNRDGVLRNARGEPFVVEVRSARGQNPYMDTIYLNLNKLGIVVKKTIVDAATGRSKMKNFDFDYTSVALRDSRMPGAELWRNFSSKEADISGSENIAGVKSHAVDVLIGKVLDANSQEELETAAHALDRVLIHSHYVIPWRYLTSHYLIYKSYLRRPAKLPTYYAAQDWALGYWWDGRAVPATVAINTATQTRISN